MGKGYKCGGAGSGLDFRIQVYPTQEAMTAAAPANKTFGIVTDADVTGWSIDRSEPAEPAVGLLWIETGMSSLGAVNALAYNSILICPVAAHQYTAEGWVDRHGETFLDGTWVNWEPETVYLFRAGDQNVEITGGWFGVDLAAETISLSHYTGTADASIYSRTHNPVDFTDFGVLSVVVDSFFEDFEVTLEDSSGNKIATAKPAEPGAVAMNLANITGSYFIRLRSWSHDNDGNVSTAFTVSEVKMLKNDSVQEMKESLTVLGVKV